MLVAEVYLRIWGVINLFLLLTIPAFRRECLSVAKVIDDARIAQLLATNRHAEAEQIYGGPISPEKAEEFRINTNLIASQITTLQLIDRLGEKVLSWEALLYTGDEEDNRFVTAVTPESNQAAGRDPEIRVDISTVAVSDNLRDAIAVHLLQQDEAVSSDDQVGLGYRRANTDSLVRLTEQLMNPDSVGRIVEIIKPGRRLGAVAIENSIRHSTATVDEIEEIADAEIVEE